MAEEYVEGELFLRVRLLARGNPYKVQLVPGWAVSAKERSSLMEDKACTKLSMKVKSIGMTLMQNFSVCENSVSFTEP